MDVDTAGQHGQVNGTAEQDTVVRTIDVYLCNQHQNEHNPAICLLGQPLRPPWRPYEYSMVKDMRFKPNARRLEVDVPLDTDLNYNKDDGPAYGAAQDNSYKRVEQVTHRSHQVEQPTITCMGRLIGDKLLLVPIDMTLQMRPTLTHLNVQRKGSNAEGDGVDEGQAEEDEEADQPAVRAVEVQVLKRETERQAQARLNSYAYLAQQEAGEPWKSLTVMSGKNDTTAVWEKLLMVPTNQEPEHLSRSDYLASFAPSSTNPLSMLAGYGSTDNTNNDTAAAVETTTTTLDKITDACKAAFKSRMEALFDKHTVCNLENIRQWLLDTRHATNETAKTATVTAKDAATLDDRSLAELLLSLGLPLVAMKRGIFVLQDTGRGDMDKLRKVVVELLQEKESFRRSEIIEAANKQAIAVTDSLYLKVVKDMCVNRNNMWHLKTGADF